MARRIPVALVWLLITGAHAQVPAADWPFIQGPSFNGHADDEALAASWPESGPPVLWARELGQGYSSFVIAGDRCVTQYQSPFGQFVVCLDANTGTTLWEYRYGLPYEALGIYPGPRATPTISDGRVYFVAPDGLTGCLTLDGGKLVWSENLKQKFDGQGTDFGSSASPLVIDGMMIVPIGGSNAGVVAVDAVTGEVRWKSGSDSASYCPVVPIQLEGEQLLVAYLENSLAVLGMQGGVLWSEQLSVGYNEHSAIPLYQEPLLIVAAPFRGGATAYELAWARDEQGARKIAATLRWQSQSMSNDVVTSAIVGELLCGFDLRDPQSKAHRPSRGVYRGLDVQTGEVLWSHEEVGQAGVVACGKRLVFFSDAGEILLAEASRTGLEIRGKASVFPDEVCWTRPALSNGRLYLRTHSRAMCLLVGDDSQRESSQFATQTLDDVRSSPRSSWQSLLGGEREHPFMTIRLDEAWLWYRSSLGWAMLPALPLLFLARRFSVTKDGPRRLGIACAGLIIAGLLATPLLNARGGEFVFTWPVAIFAALQLAVLASDSATLHKQSRRAKWLSWLAGLGLIAGCVLYFAILRALSEPMEWVFLLGLFAAFPFAVFASRLSRRGARSPELAIVLVAGFSALFWSALGDSGGADVFCRADVKFANAHNEWRLELPLRKTSRRALAPVPRAALPNRTLARSGWSVDLSEHPQSTSAQHE